VVDSLCSEYGWTIEQVFDCTRDQVHALQDSIASRREVEAQFMATIHVRYT
jgi:hypothetical protein